MAEKEKIEINPVIINKNDFVNDYFIKLIDIIVSDAPLEKCLDSIMEEACKLTSVQYGNILLINESTRTLNIESLYGYTSEEKKQCRGINLDLNKEEGICSSAVLKKKAILANDVTLFSSYIELLSNIRSELAVPIWYQDKVIGVINLESTTLNAFNEERGDITLVNALGKLVALAIESRKKVSNEVETMLSTLMWDIDATEKKLSETIVEWITNKLHVGECSLFLLKHRSEKLVCVASSIHGKLTSDLVGDEYELGEGLTGWIAAHLKPLLINNLHDPKEFQKYYPNPQWANKPVRKLPEVVYQKYLGVPIKIDSKVIGVIRISDLFCNRDLAVRDYVYSDQSLLETIAGRFANTLSNIKERTKLKEIYSISADINSQISKDVVLHRILEASIRMTEATEGTIYSVKETELIPYAMTDDNQQGELGLSITGKSIPSWVACNKREYLCGNVYGIPNDGQSPTYVQIRGKVMSELAVPMIHKQEVIGVIDVGSTRKDAFNKDDIWSLSLLAEQVVTAVERSSIIENLEDKTTKLLQLSEKLHDSTVAAVTSAITVGNVHSVRNALGGVKEALERLNKLPYIKQNNEVSELVDKVSMRINEMSEIFYRSLQFYESMSPEFESIDINALIKEVGEIMYPKITSRHIALNIIPTQDLPNIRGDKLLLRVVFINLLFNAIDASPRMIRIRTGITDKVVGGQWMQFVKISISDDGYGIPADILGKVFEPFYTTKKRGSGLGLFVSKDIVQKHGGNISVESVVGKGTVFHIELSLKLQMEEGL
jgi:signal transduction histidine kinase